MISFGKHRFSSPYFSLMCCHTCRKMSSASLISNVFFVCERNGSGVGALVALTNGVAATSAVAISSPSLRSTDARSLLRFCSASDSATVGVAVAAVGVVAASDAIRLRR